MTPTTDDLRTTLRAMADEHPPPAPSDLLAELRAERSARRTRRGWIGAAGVAAAAAVAVAATQAWPEPTATAPADDPGVASTSWELVDGDPPEYADGLHLLESAVVDASDEVLLPSTESDTQRYAVLWCDTGPAIDDPAIAEPRLVVQAGADRGEFDLPCRAADGADATASPVPLPPTGEEWSATWEGDLPSRADITLGIYEEVAHADYPFPGWPDPLQSAPEPGEGAVTLNEETPLSPQPVSSGQEGTVMVASTIAGAVSEDSTIELWTSVPGRIQVWIDGDLVTDDGDDLQAWESADPALRGGAFSAFTAGQRLTLPVPPEIVDRGEPIRVTARASHAQPWRVSLTGADGAQPAQAGIAPLDPDAVPDGVDEWYGGLHRLAAWELPTDGTVSPLELPEQVQGETVTWLVACPGVEPSEIGMATVTVDSGPRLERGCGDLEVALLNLGRSDDGTPLTAGSQVRVGLPAHSGDSAGVVAAYVPVSFAEFEHEGARAADEIISEEAVLRGEPEVVASLTLDDLSAGRATVAVPGGASIVRATSEGVGRVRVSHEGRPVTDDVGSSARPAWDGWWTAWTDQPSTRLLSTDLEQRVSSGDELLVEVEGYQGGSLTLELLARADD